MHLQEFYLPLQKVRKPEKKIARKGEDYYDSLKDKFDDLFEAVNEKFEKVKEEVNEYAEKVKDEVKDNAEKKTAKTEQAE